MSPCPSLSSLAKKKSQDACQKAITPFPSTTHSPSHSRPEINPRLRKVIKKMPRPLHNLNTRPHAPRPQRLDRARALLPGDQVVGAAVDQEGRGAVGAG